MSGNDRILQTLHAHVGTLGITPPENRPAIHVSYARGTLSIAGQYHLQRYGDPAPTSAIRGRLATGLSDLRGVVYVAAVHRLGDSVREVLAEGGEK